MKTNKFTKALAVVMNTKKVEPRAVSALKASLLRGMKLSNNQEVRNFLGV